MKYVDPPFGLGETLSGKDSDSNLINSEVLGKVFEFPANDLSVSSIRGTKSRRTGRTVKAVALRNESGIKLYGKRLARLTRTAGYSIVESVDGYAAVLAEKLIVVIDEFLATDGVADDDIFWGIIEGPVIVLTPNLAGADFNGVFSVGDELVAATGTTTGTSLVGRISNVTLVGQTGTTEAYNAARWTVGTAMSAATTGNTDSNMLINACIKL